MSDPTRTPQPLAQNFRIVDGNGFPTQYFIRWAQDRQEAISGTVTPDQVTELISTYLAAHPLTAGTGISLSPDGNIAHNVTIALNARLGQLTDVDLSTPPTDAQVLTYEASSSKWKAKAGGGGGGSSLVGAHRYWGIFDMTGQSGNIQFQALHWTLGAGAPVYPANYYASSYYGSGYEPNNLKDDTGTYWAASGLTAWLFGDFTNPVSFDKLGILPVAAAVAQAPTQGVICFSDDAINWTPLLQLNNTSSSYSSISLYQWTAGVYYNLNIPLKFPGASGGGAYSLVQTITLNSVTSFNVLNLDFVNNNYEFELTVVRPASGAAATVNMNMALGSTGAVPTWYTGQAFFSAGYGNGTPPVSSGTGYVRIGYLGNSGTLPIIASIKLSASDDGLTILGRYTAGFWESGGTFDCGPFPGIVGSAQFTFSANNWTGTLRVYAISKK